MFKWTKEILLTLAKKVNPKQAFLLLGMIVFLTGSYFILDRLLDYKEAIDLNRPKKVIEKDIVEREHPIRYNENDFQFNQQKAKEVK